MDKLTLAADAALSSLIALFDGAEPISHLCGQVSGQLRFQKRPAIHGKLGKKLHPMLLDALASQGIEELYIHQTEAISCILGGLDTLVSSPTASGKTLCYNLPVLHSIMENRDTRALYLFPLKALARDQLRSLRELGDVLFPPIHAAVYDGDTPQAERKRLRSKPPQILLTNPDMLHFGLLPHHAASWASFFSQLRYVILDEVHTYRGIFGAHMAHLIRRLLRVARRHGANPLFVLSSATIGNPQDLALKLTGREARIIDHIGSPSPGTRLFVLNPDLSPATVASTLTIACIRAGYKTIVFTKARKTTELLYTWISQSAPELASRISSYRSGFLPEERRLIEKRLFSGELDAVISTSALEVGIDIGGLDACILVGYPGSITATFQRAGRVGRGTEEGLVFLISGKDALDQYFARNPEELLRRGFEHAVLDPAQEEVMRGHLLSAAAEQPLALTSQEGRSPRSHRRTSHTAEGLNSPVKDLLGLESAEQEYDGLPVMPILQELLREGRLDPAYRRNESLLFSKERYPHKEVDMRATGDTFTIFDSRRDRVVGHLSGGKVFTEGHAGAVYLHHGQSYLVDELDEESRTIRVHQETLPYYTQTLSNKETEILEIQRSRPLGNVLARYGKLRVTTEIHAYQKRRVRGQELLSTHALELPPLVLHTQGLWWEIDDELGTSLVRAGKHLMGSLHAVEHCTIGLMPLFVLCDRLDLGGICFPEHGQTHRASIFIYDGHSAGMGLAKRGWELGEQLLLHVLRVISGCPCADGCPSCIQAPRCGSGNKPLDKSGAVLLLELMLDRRPLALENPISHPGLLETGEKPAMEEPPPQESPRILVFDLETRRSAQEVGGWHNAHLMRLAVGVIYDVVREEYRVFEEDQVEDLLDLLRNGELIIGFNLLAFDYKVLRAYTPDDLCKLPTLDLLVELKKRCGHRIGLGAMCRENLGVPKSADGLQSLEWFRQGQLEKVIEYCKKDVELTWRLFREGQSEGSLRIPGRGKRGSRSVKIRWDLGGLLRARKGT